MVSWKIKKQKKTYLLTTFVTGKQYLVSVAAVNEAGTGPYVSTLVNVTGNNISSFLAFFNLYSFLTFLIIVPPVYAAVGFTVGSVTISSDNQYANMTASWEIDQADIGV
jgi:hypothetical protein